METLGRKKSLPDFTLLSEYEEWAAQNWIHQPGTDSAQIHARAKLDEEVSEFQEAIISSDSTEIISEAGDILWTAHASGANTDISLSSALNYTFPNTFAAGNIPSVLIDETATQTYDGISLTEYNDELTKNGNAVFKYTKQWFNLRHLVATDTPENFTEAIIWTKHHRGSIALARLVLLTSHGLRQYANTGIETAMHDNYQKIESRIASGAPVTKPAHGLRRD